ncbi:hypothetical protein [Streptomyces nitrosporeus]|uniref:hypothetical protein n=1 Tax=Streptomyces nitrosporeus TaxID=28894 RepID=UPI0039A10B3E
MSRHNFGQGVADFIVAPADGIWMVAPDVQVTFWSAQVDGTQYTDLLDATGNSINYVTSDAYGALPRFSGPDEVFGMWADAGGGRRAWLYAHSGGKGAPGDPGAHWYFGTSNPADAGLSPVAGDIYVTTDTGDLYAYDGTTWILRTNIRGPQGATGGVATVNGQTGAVSLTAADIGAFAASGGTYPSPLRLDGPASTYRILGIQSSGTDRWQIQVDGITESGAQAGSNFRLNARRDDGTDGGIALWASRATQQVATGTTSPLGTAGLTSQAGIATKDTATDPAAASGGIQLYSKGGRAYVREAAGPIVPIATPGTWLPQDYGLAGWAYDLHAGSRTPGDAPGQAQRLYLIGVPLRAPKTVSQIAIHVMGYDKPNSTTTNFRFGIYDAAFALKAQSNGDQRLQLPEVHSVGGQMAKLTLSAPVSLAAGMYYVALLVKTSAVTATPYLAATNWGTSTTTSGAVAVSTSGVHRWLQSTSTALTALPASGTLTAASFTEATTCYWAAIV